jgi:membrane protein EpsK
MQLNSLEKNADIQIGQESGSSPKGGLAATRRSVDLSRRQLAKNVGGNLVAFGFGTISAFFLTPYWIRSFGVAGYGLVPLIANLVTYFTLISFLINSSISRFLTIAIAQKDFRKAEQIFNTSLIGSLAAGVLMTIVGLAILPFIGHVVQIPEGHEADVRVMFLVVLLTLVASTASTTFGTAIFCSNQLNINSRLDIINRAVAMIVSLGLVATFYSRPSAVTMGGFAGTLCVAAANIHYWRRLMPWLKIRFRDFDWNVLREQTTYGLWIVVNQFGAILFLYVDLFVVNRTMGAFAAGQYAALLQWSILLRAFATALAAPFAPTTIHCHAGNDRPALVKHLRLAIRIMGITTVLPVVLIAGFSQPLLTLWLGQNFANLGPLLALLMIPLGLNLAALPLLTLQQAVNKVKIPAIVTCLLGLCNVGLALLLSSRPEWGMYGVAAAGAIMLTGKNVIFTTLHASRILEERWTFFIGELARVAGLMGVMFLFARCLSAVFQPQSWIHLILLGAMATAAYGGVAWLLALKADEKAFILNRVKRKQPANR